MRKGLLFLVVVGLASIAWMRTEFSVSRVSAPLDEGEEKAPSLEVFKALDQPYHFLDRGRQAFVFESEDRQFVIKFFDRTYIQIPWYAGWFVDLEVETLKRDQRRFFYWNSYRLANTFLPQETALLWVHQGKSQGLPKISVMDKASRVLCIDLNQVPFVLQKKGGSFYDFLDQVSESRGKEALLDALQEFLSLIERRISLNLSDADHDVRHNFGCLEGHIVHLDPGRLTLKDLSNPELRKKEWWRATYSLRKWLLKNHPEVALDFDACVKKKKEKV